jgi:hypothetical protein
MTVNDDVAVNSSGDDDKDFSESGDKDDVLEGAFPKRKGRVDVVSWRVTEEIEYRLFYGRLFRRWGIGSWGLVTLSRGAVIGEVTYDDRPAEFTRDGLIAWLMESGVDAGAAVQLTELAVAARGDLFPGEQSGADELESEPSDGE